MSRIICFILFIAGSSIIPASLYVDAVPAWLFYVGVISAPILLAAFLLCFDLFKTAAPIFFIMFVSGIIVAITRHEDEGLLIMGIIVSSFSFFAWLVCLVASSFNKGVLELIEARENARLSDENYNSIDQYTTLNQANELLGTGNEIKMSIKGDDKIVVYEWIEMIGREESIFTITFKNNKMIEKFREVRHVPIILNNHMTQ